MREQSKDIDYEAGDYVDCHTNDWYPRIIVSKIFNSSTNEFSLKVRDPQYKNSIIEAYSIKSPKIRPYRTHSQIRFSYSNMPIIFGKKFEPPSVESVQLDLFQRLLALDQFLSSYNTWSPKNILHFLRGRHFYFNNQLLSSQLQEKSHYQITMNYFKANRRLLTEYIKIVDFDLANTDDIYADRMSAICSAYPEILQISNYAIGVHRDMESFKKQYSAWFVAAEFEAEIQRWVDQELFPAILEAKHENFNPGFTLGLMCIIGDLLTKVLSKKIKKAPAIMQMLYQQLKTSIETKDFPSKYLYTFQNQCISYFKMFRTGRQQQFDDQSQTQQLEQVNLYDFKAVQADRKHRQLLTNEKQQLANTYKADLRMRICKIYLRKNQIQSFSKAFINILKELVPKTIINNQQQLPSHVQLILEFIKQNNLLEPLLSDKNPTQANSIRLSIIKLFGYCPQYVLNTLIEKQRFGQLKSLLHPTYKAIISYEFICGIIDKMIAKSKKSASHRELLDFLSYMQKMMKQTYPMQQNILLIREKLINSAFSTASKMKHNENKILTESLLEFNDPLRQKCWIQFTQNYALPNSSSNFCYFYQISLQKYVQKYSVDIKSFANLCSFMVDHTIVDDKYERRKAIVVQALNFQYKYNRQNYLEYLQCFLDAFLDNAHQRQNHDWVSLMVYPTDQKLPSFLDLPMTVQFCKKYLDRMPRVYYELDIHLFCKLMLKLNILTDSINYNIDNDQIAKVTNLPDYFTNLITNLYNNLSIPRFKTIQRQLQRYFHAPQITQILYNKLLTIMLEQMIIKQFKRPEVNMIFKRLKTRQFMINVLSSNRPDETIYCENLNAQEKFLKLDEIFKRFPHLYALAEQEQKRALDVAFNRADSLKVLRHRLAFQLNRQPTDIILIHQNSKLSEEDYRLSFQEVYFDQCHNISKNSENSKPFIQFRFSDHPPPIRNRIIEKIPILFRYLPSTNSILKGVDMIELVWERYQSLHLLKNMLESSLKKGDYNQDMYDCNEKLDVLLNYAIWKTNPKDGYITYPLLSYLRQIDSIQTTRRSFKILFLVNRSQYGFLKIAQCQQIISCMMPQNTNSKDKSEKISTIIAQDRIYKQIMQIASNLIGSFSQKPLEFMSTFCYYPEVQRTQQFMNIYQNMWHSIFVKTEIREKKIFFETFEEKCQKFPENMQDFYRLIEKGELEAHQPFYCEVLKTLITILLKYRRRNISLKQLKISQILILTIQVIIRYENISHPKLYQKEFVDLLFFYIYLYGEQTQTPILNIMRIVMMQENCRKAIINFFNKEIKQKEWSSRPYLIRPGNKTIQLPGRVGLRNPHSICYANCFLQQLFHIQIFRDELLHAVYSEKEEPEEDFMYQLKKIFLNLSLGRQAYLNADFFKAFKGIDGTQTSLQIQMDVDQFRNMLLERIQSSIPSTNNFVKNIFNGKQVSIITSQQCSHISKKQQQFSSLCVDVKGFNSLFHSLENYFKPQILSGDNSYFCEDCNRKVTAQKTIQIESYPPYLTFVLKRFEYVSYNRHKINSYFEFPLQNLTYFQGVNYRLKGIIVHIGFSEAGHYVSYAKHNNLWYQFNDCYVQQVNMDIIKENCFGNKGKGSQNNISNLKNAYLLIYQAQKLLYKPSFKESQSYYGIKDEFKRVSKNIEINKKERVYFNHFYQCIVNQMANIYKDSNSLYLLFWTLFSIHLKIKSEVYRYQILVTGLRALKENRYNCKFIWEKQDFGRIKDLLACQMPSEYKSILVQLLIDNCSEYNQSFQAMLQVCLKMISHEKAEHSGYYMFMHLAAKKFDDGWRYLNRQRVVGRILDSIFLGIIGEKVREDFKSICEVDYQLTFTNASKPFKDNTKAAFKYHKWALIVYIIQRSSNDLHEIEKQNYLFQTTTHIFQSLFAESSDKSSLKYLSKFLSLLCKNNQDYSQALIKFLFDQIKQKADPIKYLRVLRDVLDIKDTLSVERNNSSCIFFLRHFSSRYSDRQKKELTFLYMWQWYIYLMSSNLVFRSKVKSTTQLFQQLKSVTINHLNLPRIRLTDGTIRYEVNKQPLYGVSVPTTVKQLEKLLRQCNSKMDFILRDETQQLKIIDFDGDLVEEKPEENSIIIRFDEKKVKFTKMKVVFAFADLICLQNLSSATTENQNYFVNYCLGDEKLRRITSAVSSFLITEPPKRKQSSSDNQGQSPRSP